MTEIKKRKKFYKIGETVWIKADKVEAEVTELDTKALTATVKVTVDANTHLVKTLPLWEITKLRKKAVAKVKPASTTLNVKVRYLTPTDETFKPLEMIKQGNWIDLRAAKDMEFEMDEAKLIPLGVAMQLPEGYEAHVVPRSSTLKNFGLIQANHVGVIDNSYSGDNDQWFFSAIATIPTSVKRGDRICQFRLQRVMPKVSFETVETLGNADRGGFGSTGTK